MGPWGTAGMPCTPPADHPAWPDLAVLLDWLPLASLLLTADGTALAVSRAWSCLSGLAAEDSRADGWVSAVDLPDRGVLRARLRDAALAGQTGYADVRLAGQPAGRWSRWWWRPVRAGRLIVCVADLAESRDRDDQWQRDRSSSGRLVRRSEFVNLVGRALRRVRHHGERVAVMAIRLTGTTVPGGDTEPSSDLLPALAELVSAAAVPVCAAAQVAPGEFLILLDDLGASRDARTIASQVRGAVTQMLAAGGRPAGETAVTGVAVVVADGSGRGAGELIENALSAARPGRQAAGPGPRVPRQAGAGADAAASPGMLVYRLLTVGTAIQRASALAGSPVAARLQQALEQMDNIIRDIQDEALESVAPQPSHGARGQ